jgi:hypothetical protein
MKKTGTGDMGVDMISIEKVVVIGGTCLPQKI